MALRQSVSTDDAPQAIGPYSQAIRTGSLLFCSGQVPLDPSSGELVKEDVVGQARRCLENLSAVCEAAGASLSQAVRCTVYLADMGDFARVNEVNADHRLEQLSRQVIARAMARRGVVDLARL